MRGSRVAVRAPEGEVELRLPLPGLYNVYNALAALTAALRLGIPLEQAASALGEMEAVFGRVETIEVDGKAVSILLIKNPAGANEVLRTLLLEADANGDGDGLDLWIALNDRIADGRDVSWVWDADFELLAGHVRQVACAGTRAAEMAVRLKYAGAAAGGDHGRGGDRPLARSRRRRGRRPAVRAAHLHGPARAPHPAREARARQEVLGVSSAAVWHEVECGGYAADLAGLGAAGRRRRRPRAGAGLRDGPRRPAPGAARQRGLGGRRRRRPCSRRSGRGRPREGLAVRAVCADVRALDARPRLRADPGPDAAPPDARVGGRSAARPWSERPRHLAPGGRLAAAIVEPAARLAGRPRRRPSRRPRARRLGLLEPPGRPRHRPAGGLEIRRLPPGGVPRRLAERGGAHGPPRRPGRRRARGRGRDASGLRPAGRLEVPPADGYLGSTVVVLERP